MTKQGNEEYILNGILMVNIWISLFWYHLIMSISFDFLPRVMQAIGIFAMAIDDEMVRVYNKSWGYEKVMRIHRKWSTTDKLENPVKWAIY